MEMELGKYYDVPHVRAVFMEPIWTPATPEWWPVIGPMHEDAEIINFSANHYHVDMRFMTQAQYLKGVPAGGVSSPCHRIFSEVIVNVWPDGWNTQVALSEIGDHADIIPVESYYRLQRRRFQRDYERYPVHLPRWLADLHRAHKDRQLKDNMICPHRGADLSNIAPDEDGIITCPLHGLRWCAATGAIAPLHDWWMKLDPDEEPANA